MGKFPLPSVMSGGQHPAMTVESHGGDGDAEEAEATSVTALKIRFGRNLRRLRHGANWTQGDVAAAAGVALQEISAIELGKRNLTLITMWKLANAFRVNVWQMLAPQTNPTGEK